MKESNKKFYRTLGKAFASFRKECKLTQKALSQLSGIHKSRIAKIEHGMEMCRVHEYMILMICLSLAEQPPSTLPNWKSHERKHRREV